MEDVKDNFELEMDENENDELFEAKQY